MKRNYISLMLVLASFLLGACTDAIEGWTDPQSNPQEEAITLNGFKAAPVGTIDLNQAGDSVAIYSLAKGAVPQNYVLKNAFAEVEPSEPLLGVRPTVITTDLNGKAAAADLQEEIKTRYGLRPEPRTFDAHVFVNAEKDGEVLRIDAGQIQIVAIANAPKIEDMYYVTGSINNWDKANKDLPVKNNGEDVYTSPVFTVLIPAGEGDITFKLTPASKIGTNDESENIGQDKNDATKLAYNNEGENFVIKAVSGAKFYRVTFNMIEKTWKSEALSFAEKIFVAGQHNNWDSGAACPLPTTTFDGNYQGYYYLAGEFKFKPNYENWDGNWGKGSQDGTLESNAGNITAEEGFYQINVNIANLTYSLNKVNNISVIGAFNGWGADVDLTYNKEERCWEGDITLDGGEFKIRMNHDWNTSWGTNFNNMTSNGGSNLTLPAGKYHFKFFLSGEGQNRLEYQTI